MLLISDVNESSVQPIFNLVAFPKRQLPRPPFRATQSSRNPSQLPVAAGHFKLRGAGPALAMEHKAIVRHALIHPFACSTGNVDLDTPAQPTSTSMCRPSEDVQQEAVRILSLNLDSRPSPAVAPRTFGSAFPCSCSGPNGRGRGKQALPAEVDRVRKDVPALSRSPIVQAPLTVPQSIHLHHPSLLSQRP